jgi:hypothetical protein
VRVRVRTGRLIPENEQSKLDIKEVRINALPRVRTAVQPTERCAARCGALRTGWSRATPHEGAAAVLLHVPAQGLTVSAVSVDPHSAPKREYQHST